uniref:Uncharacterized protein n=1 Tax=Helianthus annuus TaxID=4232 RepID=A0A251T115_HELAN
MEIRSCSQVFSVVNNSNHFGQVKVRIELSYVIVILKTEPQVVELDIRLEMVRLKKKL